VALLGGVLIGAAAGYIVFFGLPSAADNTSPLPTAVAVAQIALAGLEPGNTAPTFELETADGTPVGLKDHLGDVVLLNFWATWCAPCRIEMPLLESTFRSLEDQGFVVLGIDFDESADLVNGFRDELGLSFPLLLDPGGEVQELYRVRGYPTTVILDREGRILNYHIGILTRIQLNEYLADAGLSK
jgi:peroxiredoxin